PPDIYTLSLHDALPIYLATGEEMIAWGAPIEAVRNTVRIADMCEEYELPKAEPVKFGVDNPYEVLVDLCRKGWKKRKIPKPKWEDRKSTRLNSSHVKIS